MNTDPKHRVIFQTLYQEILAGRYDADGRIPSETALARRFGASRPTVAHALRELAHLDLLQRRVGSGSYLRRRAAAGGKAIGLIAAGLSHTEILDPICAEIARAAQAQDYAILWGDASSDAAPSPIAQDLCQQYIQRQVAGVFFAPLELVPDREAVNQRIAQALKVAGVPVVLLDRDIVEFPGRSGFDLVGVDNFLGALALTEHLISRGRRRLRFVAKPRYPSTTDLRIAGCREALCRHGLAPQGDWVRVGDPADASFVRQLLAPPPPDGLLCSNDLTAAVLIRTLGTLGRQVPRDVAVVGFDDVKYATLLAVPLTTMRQPCRDIATAAVQCLLERIKAPARPGRQILLPAELVVRESCSPS